MTILSQQFTKTKNTKNYLVNASWIAILRNSGIIFVGSEKMSVTQIRMALKLRVLGVGYPY
jgi:hypothetical protein